jgi:5-methyltetrahydrofolate--homocysteine methyltransferase
MADSPELLGRLDPDRSSYLTALRERVLIFDGAMGTNLQLLGLSPEDFGGPELEGCNESLISTRPDLIAQVHRSFFEVGCDVVESGTFGSSSVVLTEYGLADRAREISRIGAEIATSVAAEFATPDRPRWVAGSMGPGTKFPTLGQIPYADLRDAYEEQALGLLEGGVDFLLIETVFDLLSAKSAISGARRAMVALDRIVPLQVQVTIELTGRMLPGTEIAAALTVLDAMQVDVVGLNCATGPVEMSEALRHLSGASRVPIACVPNAGLPSVVDGMMHYDLTPDQLAEHLHRFVTEFGVSAIGGCCGTTPAHLAAVVERCAGAVPLARTPVSEPAAASIYSSVPFQQDTSFLVVGERTNANGSKRFREAMLEADWDTCVAMARDQITEGSHLIDVCVDYTGADGVADMTEVASRFATQASVPLMVDSTEGPVARAALEWIGGRPILNSVNLEEGDEPGTRLDTFLRLAREFGAAVVCTCIDEEGQARTAEWKLRAARSIRDIAVERYGLAPEDLLFDPLALPLSTGMEESRNDGIETIEGIRAIKAELPGVSTILGLSNVSFGLNPAARQVLNSVFLHECVEAGLDSAIVHASKILPLSRIDERAKEISLDLVYNRRTDDYDPLQELLALFDGVKVNTGAQDDHSDWPVDRRLSQRIIDGNRTGLEADLTEALESGLGALGIVNDILLEGMKVVGERFASGEMQLPFVLQSAETMKAAVAFLEPHMEKADQGGKGTVVLATVKGDVHDIGKNLVDIILTNNGYEVVNLGIKIGINEIIMAAEEHKADAIGMSGLLVKSTLIMRENLVELNQRDLADFPILLGGAALTRTYVERDLREVYDGRLFYGRDAFEGLRTMDRLVELKKSGEEDPAFGREISERNVPKRSRLEPQDTTPVEGQPARADVASDNRLFTPPFVGSRVAKGIPIDDIAEYLNQTALFRNQWGERPVDGENDGEFKERVRATLREEMAKAREGDLLIPSVAYGHFAANAEGNDLIIWKDETRTSEWMRFTFPRQRKDPWLCIADFFRASDSGAGNEDFASFMLCTIGPRASEETARLFADNEYLSYLRLHGLSVEMAEATAEYWHHRIREELGIAGEDGPSLAGLFRQTYRGGRYSWGYPACPDLDDNAKVVELLGGDRIGVTVSEGFQLHPEQTTDAIICHHPAAKYFVA